METHDKAREQLKIWKESLKKNFYEEDNNLKHTLQYYFKDQFKDLDKELSFFSQKIFKELEPLVNENDLVFNNPRLESYDDVGEQNQKVIHHPFYNEVGDIIYSSGLMKKMSSPGGLLESLCFFYLSSHGGEAGHNCPIACSAGIIRIFQKLDLPNKDLYLKKLIEPSYTQNFTGAQFLTEIQGGSDVGKNATVAFLDENKQWKIKGEKWFCSNANAELILMTARFDHEKPGTKGLGLFLLPSHLPDGQKNHYTLRRLKNKIGTRSMASSEIDFNGAHAWPVGKLEEGFSLVMENVLHISRIFNTFAVLGQSSRAYQIAKSYSHFREAFGKKIIEYPLVQETLAKVKSEQLALMAFIFKTTRLQDETDTNKENEKQKLLLRVLVNLNKYISSLWAVEHIHRSIDILGGNGAIESFSPLPRLLRDSIVCENWEGTHNTLRMQILRDIHRYKVDEIFISFLRNDLYQESFKEDINGLEEDFRSLKGQNEQVQTLLIKDIVHKMSMIVSALCLSKEAIHQAENNNEKIKEKALSLFRKTHLDRPSYDNDYLNLIKEINEVEYV